MSVGGVGLATPNLCHSVAVTNKGSKTVTIVVTFDNFRDSTPKNKKTIKMTKKISAGKTEKIGPVILNMGSSTAIAPVITVANGMRKLDVKPVGIVPVMPVNIQTNGNLQQMGGRN